MPETRSSDPHLKALQALTRQHARHPLWSVVAVMAGVVQTACTIAVAALLAHIVHGLAITQASFDELNAVWWWMLPALLLRAMAALVREEAGLRMSQATRQSLRAALLDHLHTLGPAWASRQQAGGHHLAGDQVPGRQHMVHRLRRIVRAGDEGQADARIDGVVHRRPAMPVALQGELDQIGAALAQGLVFEPATRRKVGEEKPRILARRGDDRHRQLAPFG